MAECGGFKGVRTGGISTAGCAPQPLSYAPTPVEPPKHVMRQVVPTAILLMSLLVPASSMAASPVHKCEVNGKVTYQNGPCPSGGHAPRPTIEQLNAERMKRAAGAASASVTGTTKAEATPKPAAPPAMPQSEIKSGFRCDGRKYCSQMTSCAEAKYFLSHCPGVKMDGDGNRVPCERQWCNP